MVEMNKFAIISGFRTSRLPQSDNKVAGSGYFLSVKNKNAAVKIFRYHFALKKPTLKNSENRPKVSNKKFFPWKFKKMFFF